MIDKIKRLETESRFLEPGKELRSEYLDEVQAHAERFLDGLDQRPAYVLTPDEGVGLLYHTVKETGIEIEEALELVRDHVERPGLNPASGGHLGYIPGGGIYLSALGDFIADVTNRYAGVFFANPGAVRMENMMIDWAAGLVGYPDTAAGTLLSGGSLANLACIVTARDAKGIKAAEVERSVVYLTEQVHHCVTKAFRIAGLGEVVIRHVPIDDRFRMDPSALRGLVEADVAAGLRPFMVVASSGTTDTGAVDPVDKIAAAIEGHDIWLHVDAAYGGFFLLCEEGRAILRGLDLSDSIVMDPHKGLFLPYGTGLAIVKDGPRLAEAHYYTANYLQDALNYDGEMSPADLSPELTRHFRGLRMWLPLMVHGLAPFRSALSEKILLARYFREQLVKMPGMEVGPEPDLSVVLYRHLPAQGDPNDFNQRLMKRVHEDGRVFLSSTSINGTFFLRLACLSFRTHLSTIEKCLEMLRDCISQVTEDLEAV
jgi:glutamate/tyrosine decarboxylase-like PLP-dependent enzyme